MKYEVVELEQKFVVGVSAMTSNVDPKMGSIIEGLWHKLYFEGVNGKIKNKVNEYAIGLYSDYNSDGTYSVTAGNEVSKPENSDLSVKVIPKGKYAKFSAHGDMVAAVAELWQKIWQLNLDRSFSGDFEEYLSSDCENCDIDIYIALK